MLGHSLHDMNPYHHRPNTPLIGVFVIFALFLIALIVTVKKLSLPD